jgi:hypothetical protein
MFVVVAALITVSSTAARPAIAQDKTCPNAPSPRLVIGKMARVTPGTANNLREMPSKSAKALAQVEAGQFINVLEGPVCADGFAWWRVNAMDQEGWMAEGSGSNYYVAPLTSAVTEFRIPAGAKTVNVTFNGVNLTYNDVYGPKVQADTVFAVTANPDDPFEQSAPDYTEITFGDGPQTELTVPTISVYPVSEYQQVNPVAKERIGDLKTLLSQKPKDPTDDIPVLPAVNAGQAFHAQVKYLTFDGGTGVRFLTMYSQDVSPITMG